VSLHRQEFPAAGKPALLDDLKARLKVASPNTSRHYKTVLVGTVPCTKDWRGSFLLMVAGELPLPISNAAFCLSLNRTESTIVTRD
jgi:hypothetical protein